MIRIATTLALVFVFASTADAQLFRRSRGNCANGQCGVQSNRVEYTKVQGGAKADKLNYDWSELDDSKAKTCTCQQGGVCTCPAGQCDCVAKAAKARGDVHREEDVYVRGEGRYGGPVRGLIKARPLRRLAGRLFRCGG